MEKLFLVMALVPTTLFGQLIDELPKGEDGKLNFNKTVQVDSATKDQLYLKAKEFFVDAFKSSKEVIQLDDKDSGIISGKGNGTFGVKVAMTLTVVKMWFTIKVQVKDGKYRYDLYDISYKPQSGYNVTTYPEEWFDKDKYYKGNGKPRDVSEQYKNGTLQIVNGLIGNLKMSMSQQSSPKKDDW